MGTDIHLVIEVRPEVEWTLPDRRVRSLERLASLGDGSAQRRLRTARTGEWVVGAALDEWVLEDKPYLDDTLEEHRLYDWWARQDRGHLREAHHDQVAYQRDPQRALPIYDDRNYYLFATLTGTVRNRLLGFRGIVSEPRGLPPDASELALFKSAAWEADAHSHSWVSASEVLEFVLSGPRPEQSRSLGDLGAEPWAAAYGAENVRWVFWFDN